MYDVFSGDSSRTFGVFRCKAAHKDGLANWDSYGAIGFSQIRSILHFPILSYPPSCEKKTMIAFKIVSDGSVPMESLLTICNRRVRFTAIVSVRRAEEGPSYTYFEIACAAV